MLTAVIDAKEERKIATLDIPNAFIQTDNEGEKVTMKVRGNLAEMLIKMDPTIYRPYVVIEKDKLVLYLNIVKALYGMLKSALLFYKKLRKDLESNDFKVNPYDPCVANKMVNNHQFTVVWHVDDLKISHHEEKQVDKFIAWCKKLYEDDVGKVKVNKGVVHDYLGMKLDYTNKGKIIIDMKDYVKDMVESFPYQDKLKREFNTPAAPHLFDVRDDVEKLSEKKAQVFHTTVAKGLFLSKQARPDIQTTIAFLCTQVKNPDTNDWKKLLQLLGYLKSTLDLCTTLEADNNNVIIWYGDAAFGVHKDLKSHTGGTMTMGKGSVINISSKQKLNTKSSTEAELVGADDLSGHLIWVNYFLEAQGYERKDTVLYQDNKSTMLLLKNGKQSSSKRTKHINIRYFFLKDRIENNELKVKYCPTEDMMADFFTKPLQATKFK